MLQSDKNSAYLFRLQLVYIWSINVFFRWEYSLQVLDATAGKSDGQ